MAIGAIDALLAGIKGFRAGAKETQDTKDREIAKRNVEEERLLRMQKDRAELNAFEDLTPIKIQSAKEDLSKKQITTRMTKQAEKESQDSADSRISLINKKNILNEYEVDKKLFSAEAWANILKNPVKRDSYLKSLETQFMNPSFEVSSTNAAQSRNYMDLGKELLKSAYNTETKEWNMEILKKAGGYINTSQRLVMSPRDLYVDTVNKVKEEAANIDFNNPAAVQNVLESFEKLNNSPYGVKGAFNPIINNIRETANNIQDAKIQQAKEAQKQKEMDAEKNSILERANRLNMMFSRETSQIAPEDKTLDDIKGYPVLESAGMDIFNKIGK